MIETIKDVRLRMSITIYLGDLRAFNGQKYVHSGLLVDEIKLK